LILATAYLPPIWYFEKLLSTDAVVIEGHEHFVKQTIRNRAHILSPNGIQSLIVPVVHENNSRVAIKDKRISDDIPWQRQHWRSLCAAYQRSAYFEFYQDDLAPFYEKKYEFLLDYNMELLHFLLGLLQVKKSITISSEYQGPMETESNDLRVLCNGGLPKVSGEETTYPQVFGYKGGFVPGLSIVDLIFNAGPDARKKMS